MNAICQQSTCVSRAGFDGGAGGPLGTGGSAGSEVGGGSPDAAIDPDVSVEEGGVLTDGSLGDATNDEGGPKPCTANSDCTYTDPNHREVACDTGSGTCLQLTTDECPFVEGDYSGKDFPPVYVGAFATFPSDGPKAYPSYLNYALVIDEFKTDGIPAWDAKKRQVRTHRPVAIICNADADIPTAMGHLTRDLHIPAVVTQFDTIKLKATFENDESRAFFVNPYSANSTLTNGSFPTEGRLWHMLGQPSDHAPAYAAFMPRVEEYVRTLNGLGPTDPLRLATVTGNATDTLDLQQAVLDILRWNSKSYQQNQSDGNFLNVTMDSVLSGADPNTLPIEAANSSLLAFKPHLVLSFAAYEFTKLFPIYDSSSLKPANLATFYLLGPYNMVSSNVLGWVGRGAGLDAESKRKRVAGIGSAATTDTQALTNYQTRFLGKYGTAAQGALGNENYYDAMYFAVYSRAFASSVAAPTGDNLAEGMLHLVQGTAVEMGPTHIADVVGALGTRGSISLVGALGPPDFTRTTGSRMGEGSVYCLTPSGSASLPYYSYDVLRVGPPGDGGVPTLTGNFSCYNGL